MLKPLRIFTPLLVTIVIYLIFIFGFIFISDKNNTYNSHNNIKQGIVYGKQFGIDPTPLPPIPPPISQKLIQIF